jgi:peptide/nickel transport system permease protein
LQYLIRRTLYSFVTFFGVAIAVFIAMRVIPGNPIYYLLGPNATPQQVRQATESLGLNLPIYDQFVIWFRNLVTLNLGRSFITNQPVSNTIIQPLERSFLLVLLGMAISTSAGVVTGITSATYSRKKLIDNSLNSFASFLSSVPSFWVALELIAIFAVWLHWFPAGGVGGLRYMILPALVYSLFSLPQVHRTLRASMIEELEKPYCVAAKAKGASNFRIVTRHVLRNALIPLVTVLGIQVGTLLSTAVVIELIFGWPGVGLLIVNSVLAKDFLVAQDAIIVLALIIISSNTIADLFVLRLNHRVKL